MSESTVAKRLAELEELELSIDQLVAGGEGLGRFEGIPVFVPRTAPGDRVRVRLVERRPDYARAELLELIAPGPGRREPPCPHFERCGGCDLQHLDDRLQVRLKVLAVAETLKRIAGFELPASGVDIVAGDPWGWRLRCQLHVEESAGGAVVGYFARRSRELVAIDRCPVLVPELEAELATLGRRLPPGGAPRRIDLAAGEPGQITVAPVLAGLPHGDISLRVGGFDYRFDARCFFQGHRGLLGELVERVVGSWTGERAYDLYGGVGLFALPLSRRYRDVVLVEGDRIAARFARLNFRADRRAAGSGAGLPFLPQGEVVAQAVESWIGDGLPAGADRVVVDPPRAGLSGAVLDTLLARRPKRLTYLSCHSATLARDLRRLLSVYDVEQLAFIDLFPQTGHLELLVQLVESDRPSPERVEVEPDATRTPEVGESFLAIERAAKQQREIEARRAARERRMGAPGRGRDRAPAFGSRPERPFKPRREFVIDGPPRREGAPPSGDRPPRREGRPPSGGGSRPERPFKPRREFVIDGPPRREGAPPSGDRPPRREGRPPSGGGSRPERPFNPRRESRSDVPPRSDRRPPSGDRPPRPEGRPPFGSRPPRRDGPGGPPRGGRPPRPAGPGGASGPRRPAGGSRPGFRRRPKDGEEPPES